jgi:hypothetical protein
MLYPLSYRRLVGRESVPDGLAGFTSRSHARGPAGVHPGMELTITPITDDAAAGLRADIEAGRIPAKHRTGAGMPCRQCLRPTSDGESAYLFTYQPFLGTSPYTVPSPIFLHVEPCGAHDRHRIPTFVEQGDLRTLRSYSERHAIVEGKVVAGTEVERTIADLFEDDRASYVHVHDAVNGCFTFRADRSAA